MERLCRSAIAFCLLATATSVPAAPAPVLQLAGNDFPELVVHQPAYDDNGHPLELSCDPIRSKRIDELDPLWKQAVERIHMDCEDLTEESAGFDMVATVAIGFLKPGTVQFAGVPVAEIRLMDSELWGDHQYLLDRPYAEIRDAIKVFVESRCRAQQENTDSLVVSSCALTESEEGLYLEASELGGIWMHPEQGNAARTVYAEAWSD